MSEHRIILIENPARLSINLNRLIIEQGDKSPVHILPSDIAVLVLHSHAIQLTHAVLATLGAAGTVILSTDQNHMPCALQIPIGAKRSTSSRLFNQIEHHKKSLPRQIWKTIVQNRLMGQAFNLQSLELPGAEAIKRLKSKVKVGDVENIEAQGARVYWQSLKAISGQTRIKAGATDLVNSHLNFGYAILRSLIARRICSAGLNPAIGVGHRSGENPFNLADDFLECYRCLVEKQIFMNLPNTELSSESKKGLAEIVSHEIHSDLRVIRLTTSIAELCDSYVSSIETGKVSLTVPIWE
jgi:CRISP-associated protein Cas1